MTTIAEKVVSWYNGYKLSLCESSLEEGCSRDFLKKCFLSKETIMKRIMGFFALAIVAFAAMMFLSPKAHADGMHGVRETATEVLVDVPKFCRPLKVRWEAQWEWAADNEDAVLSFVQRDEKKVTVIRFTPGSIKVETIWRGGETVHIPKFAKGKLIKIKLVSILALGEENGNFSKDNWLYESQNSRWVNGAMISPPVRVGTWGRCS